jgi:PIN domain nuclease of toxin-antitoxin system
MRVLLDTNAFLWWLGKKDRLTAQAYAVIQDPENDVFLSVASVWAISAQSLRRSGQNLARSRDWRACSLQQSA